MADYIKSKGIAGIKLKQEVNKEQYEQSIKRLKQELEEISSAFNVKRKQIDEEMSNLESKLKGTREEYETKTKWINEFKTKREVVSSLLSAKEKEFKNFTDKENREKQRLEEELVSLRETLAQEKKEIENFEALNRDNLKVISSQKELLDKIETAVKLGKKSLSDFEKAIEAKKNELEQAEQTISYARIIEIGLEKREATLSKKEDICEVRRRSLERMYQRKLGINIKTKFYGKNI